MEKAGRQSAGLVVDLSASTCRLQPVGFNLSASHTKMIVGEVGLSPAVV